jgi:hypothetical protein
MGIRPGAAKNAQPPLKKANSGKYPDPCTRDRTKARLNHTARNDRGPCLRTTTRPPNPAPILPVHVSLTIFGYVEMPYAIGRTLLTS